MRKTTSRPKFLSKAVAGKHRFGYIHTMDIHRAEDHQPEFVSPAAAGPGPCPRVPDGRRLYAVGDVHGRLDLLDGLLARIHRDDDSRAGEPGELIFLGDLIDRGPDSAAIIERLIALQAERPATRFLLGNHEELFLSAIDGDVGALRFLMRVGGKATLLSYGITSEDLEELPLLLRQAVPERHRNFIRAFEDMIVEGDYLFVHAGIRPGIPLDQQRTSDLRWIREEFCQATAAPCDKVVVHGHTIEPEVVILPHRIGLDTGAYRSGVLSAMGFEGSRRWVIEERRSGAAIT